VIGCGRRAADVARWIGDESAGATRVVELDRRAGQRGEPYDLVVSPCPVAAPPNARRIEIARASDETSDEAGGSDASGWLPALTAWIDRRALAAPRNGRGTTRPQQGVEYLCARLVERGVVARSSLRVDVAEVEDAARRIEPLLGFSNPGLSPRPGQDHRGATA
jgi:hypothetical protein